MKIVIINHDNSNYVLVKKSIFGLTYRNKELSTIGNLNYK